MQAAGQVKQHRELQDVVAETQRGVALAEFARDLATNDQHDIEHRRGGDHEQRGEQRQMKAEPVVNGQQ